MNDEILRANLYDATHRGLPGDREFYQRQCPPELSVLELGCGSGRILKALAPREGALLGLESAPGHLSLAKEALGDQAQLIVADMQDFQLNQRFDRILLTFNGLFCLPGDEAMLKTFKNIRDHLKEEGKLILDVYPTDAFEEDAPDFIHMPVVEEMAQYLMDVVVDDQVFEVYEESRWYPKERRFEAEFIYAGDGPGISMTIDHYYRSPQQIIALAEQAGLTLLRQQRGFAPEESSDEDAQHILTFQAS